LRKVNKGEGSVLCMSLKNTEQYSTSTSAGYETLAWNGREKPFWRCIVCNDVHYAPNRPGPAPPA